MVPSAVLMIVSLCMFIFAGGMWDITTAAVDDLLNVDAYTSAVLGDNPVGVPAPGDTFGGEN